MNQFGANVLGKCHRFRLAAFRDNEVWVDGISSSGAGGTKQRSIQALLADPEISNHDRQAALAASRLGEDMLDGSQAVKSGLAKRGVAQTYVMLEGCEASGVVVLRGANRRL
jgi:hypothetical protein